MKLAAQVRTVNDAVEQRALTKDGTKNLPIADRIEIELEGGRTMRDIQVHKLQRLLWRYLARRFRARVRTSRF